MSSSLLPAILIESESEIIATDFKFQHRHTDEMISKLESAGLGFFVKATETQQKLGAYTMILIYNCNGTSLLL